jgi:pimeloyl-ACP methyl ester carboxylesterase
VIPGFIATDRTTMELRRAFAAAGFRTHPWALGLNTGARTDTLERLEQRLRQIGEDRVLLVGWSLGGLFARELARHAPDRVSAVVTLGSPFSGDVDRPPVPRITDKPPVPALSFWSRRDGIVAPASARGEPHESDEAVELTCNHMGFGVSRPATRQVVAETVRFLRERGLPSP